MYIYIYRAHLFIAYFISFYDLSRMKNDRYNLLTHKTCLFKLRLLKEDDDGLLKGCRSFYG